MSKVKRPIHKESVSAGKTPSIAAPPPSFRGNGYISWRFNGVDKDGAFAWTNIDNDRLFRQIIDHLAAVETMQQNELEGKENHFIALKDLSQVAQKRLVELQLDTEDNLYSIRFTGKARVFCVYRRFAHYNYMRVLWWDPKHLVCPSKKKHT